MQTEVILKINLLPRQKRGKESMNLQRINKAYLKPFHRAFKGGQGILPDLKSTFMASCTRADQFCFSISKAW